jgi:hypothetical protein
MSNNILRSLISEMVGDYLNESHEDDLIESIFEEVSEETWEAIEEAILNELSPNTLQSYVKKAAADEKRLDRTGEKHDDAASRLRKKAVRKYKQMDAKSDSDYEKSRAHSRAADKAFVKSRKRGQGIARATDRLSK